MVKKITLLVFAIGSKMSAVIYSKLKVFSFRIVGKSESNHGGGGDGGKISST